MPDEKKFKVIMTVPGVDIVAYADGSLGWKKGSGGVGGGKGKYNWLNEAECPQHGHWDYVAAGTRKDGSEYKAFWTCTDGDCLNRPSRDWTDGIDPDEYMAEYANDDSGDDLDGLPF